MTPLSFCSTPWKKMPVENLMPRFLKARSKALDDGGVLVGDQGRQAFDDGDVDAEGLPDGREFDADDAAAEDDGALGDGVHRQRFVGGDDAAADFQARK